MTIAFTIKRKIILSLITIATLSNASTHLNKNSYTSNQNFYKEIKHVENVHLTYQKGEYATALLENKTDSIEWAKKFSIVQVGGINDDNINKKLLQEKGILDIKYHIGYDWMPALYYYTNSTNKVFTDWLHTNKGITTLNPDGPFPHCRMNHYDWCEDYYYNYFDQNTLNRRVKNLIENMKEKDFNGVFFDWGSAQFLLENENKKIHKYVEKKYPHKTYLDAVANFYKKLKENNVFVITNQAFRNDSLLANVSYDMTESYITTTQDIKKKVYIQNKGALSSLKITRYYPIYKDSKTIEDSIYFLNILDAYKKKYQKNGFKNFIYMNYLSPRFVLSNDANNTYIPQAPKNAIYYGFAMAKLTGSIAYGEVQGYRRLERDKIYFYNLGTALGEKHQKLDALSGYIRYYQNGFVLVSNAYKKAHYLKISLPNRDKDSKIFDTYNKKWIQSDKNSVVIKLEYEKSMITNKYSPLGRVYLYNKK